jgi:cold-inducible RNA-binding protein
MGSKVYVGNLPFSVDEQQLRALFEEGGREVLEINIVMDRDTGRPRGFAFVNMANQEDAQAVITALNGRDLGGRALTVNMAREQQPRGSGPGRGGFGRGGGGGRRDRY